MNCDTPSALVMRAHFKRPHHRNHEQLHPKQCAHVTSTGPRAKENRAISVVIRSPRCCDLC